MAEKIGGGDCDDFGGWTVTSTKELVFTVCSGVYKRVKEFSVDVGDTTREPYCGNHKDNEKRCCTDNIL